MGVPMKNPKGRWTVTVYDENASSSARLPLPQTGIVAKMHACDYAKELSESERLSDSAVVRVECAQGVRRIYKNGSIVEDNAKRPSHEDTPVDW